MASDVGICNLALGHLGNRANVSAINPPDASVEAERCAEFYPIARDGLLERHAWRFATRRAVLAEVENTTTSWALAYALPGGCVRPLAVLFPESTDDTDAQDYTIETDDEGAEVLYTNVEQATLKFIVRVEDANKFTPLFVSALARLLASYLAGPILKGAEGMKVAAAHLKIFEEVDLPRAVAANANSTKNSAYGARHVPGHIKARS